MSQYFPKPFNLIEIKISRDKVLKKIKIGHIGLTKISSKKF